MASGSLLPRIDEALVWSVELRGSAAALDRYGETLSRDEWSRANRFLLPEVRERFIVCRGVLREIVGRATEQAPGGIRFRYEQWGKPYLEDPPRGPLHFNVSHSADRALIAVARTPLGIDLEVPHDRVNHRAIAAQILSPHESIAWDLIAPPQRREATMRLWVCKEALLKALGLGIAEGLQRVTFPLPLPAARAFHPLHIDAGLQLHLDEDGTCRRTSWLDAAAWKLRQLDSLPNCFAALATSSSIAHVELNAFEA